MSKGFFTLTVYILFMDIEKTFRTAFLSLLEQLPYGGKSRLAREVGLSPQQLHHIETGRNYGSETQRRAIAAALGYPGRAYEDFLNIGREVPKPTRAKTVTSPPTPQYQRVIDIILSLDQTQLAALEGMLAAFRKQD